MNKTAQTIIGLASLAVTVMLYYYVFTDHAKVKQLQADVDILKSKK